MALAFGAFRTKVAEIGRLITATAEWALLEPLLPDPACQTSKGGRPEKWHAATSSMRSAISHGAKEVLFRLRLIHPEITGVWTDSSYSGQLVDWAEEVPEPDDKRRHPAPSPAQLRRPSAQVGGGTLAFVDHVGPSPLPRL
ncbi:hypothetical protein SGFS_004370 [Streptomyces graminofaciens]|uniref:Transposase n=1 Tax=Streptomyces graminofaciens TaxID=68212 RepID=A0ABN5V7Q7_9ACTN|nr:hypothetical protein SGFS_004370 [Streptomyces graminofaciens]